METHTLNKHDFKKYLLEQLPDSRQEELIFWKKSIPLPVDLIYKIFDSRGELFRIYLDHISAITLFFFVAETEKTDYVQLINNLPNSGTELLSDRFKDQFERYYFKSNISALTASLAEKLFVVEYKFCHEDYITALSHEGRKYRRMYVPYRIKEVLREYDPGLLNYIGVSNGDMFGNIVADHLGVYRSGFSDAFAAIFNKLLDFIVAQTYDHQVDISAASRIKISQIAESPQEYIKPEIGTIADGSLWEPRYRDAKSTFILNKKHPYLELIDKKSGIEVLADLAGQSALIENETLQDSKAKTLENFRQEISRKLRLISENPT